METYLPIACVINLLRGASGALRERLIQRIEACLGPDAGIQSGLDPTRV